MRYLGTVFFMNNKFWLPSFLKTNLLSFYKMQNIPFQTTSISVKKKKKIRSCVRNVYLDLISFLCLLNFYSLMKKYETQVKERRWPNFFTTPWTREILLCDNMIIKWESFYPQIWNNYPITLTNSIYITFSSGIKNNSL